MESASTMIGMTPDSPATAPPLVIAEKSHPIRHEMIDADAVFVMRKLNRAGFASYLVGGGVRDLYLGKAPKDFDISTDARPGQIRKIFPNSATIGRRFRLVQIFFKSGKIIEVSTLRSMSEHDLEGPQAVLAPNNTYGNLPDDARRRDLSINSLFYDLESNTIIDYVGGVDDLNNGVIRIVGEPDKRIHRDPVRMMRAIRHSARTGFRIEEETWRSIRRNHDQITLCPPSRIRDELFKDLYGGSAASWFDLSVDSHLFTAIFPFYAEPLRASDHQPNCRQQLHTILELLDAIHRQSRTEKAALLPKFFILALLVLPWAEYTYHLSTLKMKSSGVFQLSKKIRLEIDDLLGVQLNLRRSLRQEMVVLLSNLPQFVRFVQDNAWPKWLRRKSYFSSCLLFSQFHQQMLSEQSDVNAILASMNIATVEAPAISPEEEYPRRKTRPAFSPRKKGGVFGFRK